MRVTFNIKDDSEIKNLAEYLKKNYNLKLVGLIKYIYRNPEIIKQISDDIDEYDSEYRFNKNMK